MNCVQSSQDQPSSSTISITVLSVTPARAKNSSRSPLSKSTSTMCRSGFTESARCTPGARPLRSSAPSFAMPAACGERRLPCWKKSIFRAPERCSFHNPHTRRAYARACSRFFAWCEDRGLTLATIRAFDVATYIEALQQEHSVPGVKHQFAAVRMLFDRVITG